MKSNNKILHSVWNNSSDLISLSKVEGIPVNLNELTASLFCPGEFYFYLVDFSDRQIKFLHPNVQPVLGLDPSSATFDDIINQIHPEDIDFVAHAEETVLRYLYENIGRDKVLEYKMSYCFRLKTKDGSYQLFQHQAIILSTDQEGAFAQSVNIHTNINHLVSQNSYSASLINIKGGKSFFNIEVPVMKFSPSTHPLFTAREIQLIKYIAMGLLSKNIAERMNISIHTVKTHRKNILQKAQVKNSSELISKCIVEGLI